MDFKVESTTGKLLNFLIIGVNYSGQLPEPPGNLLAERLRVKFLPRSGEPEAELHFPVSSFNFMGFPFFNRHPPPQETEEESLSDQRGDRHIKTFMIIKFATIFLRDLAKTYN